MRHIPQVDAVMKMAKICQDRQLPQADFALTNVTKIHQHPWTFIRFDQISLIEPFPLLRALWT